MNDSVELWEKPGAAEIYMIAGWRQWADAGALSSNLPQYLVNLTEARRIGVIKTYGYYLFQIPGMHYFLRPEIKLQDGYRRSLKNRKNEIFYTGNDQKGLVIFLGDEPHLNAEQYAEAFFDIVEALAVKRVVVLGGVYGEVPYDKERQVSCVYSLPRMKKELHDYALRFFDYEGGVSIGSYLADQAEQRGIEYLTLYGFVPDYDFTEVAPNLQGVMIENDFKAWYDVMRRLNHMFQLQLDLSDLARRSDELILAVEEKLADLEQKAPQLKLKEYLEQISQQFTEMPFMPLDEVWERELGDLLKDMDEE